MDFKRYRDKAVAELDKEVEKILKEQLSEATKIDKKLTPLIKAFASSCQGGKRIRGVLVKLGFEMANGKSREIAKIGAASEIVHTAILVHDDIIDKSLSRRTKPSLHQALGGNHYGISQAISLADYGFFLGLKIISKARFPHNRKIKALELFSEVMADTTLGEILDLEKTDPMTVMRLKTARYTIAGPLQLGVILAGGNQKRVRALGDFGENLGIAFQIRDDILDAEVDWVGGVDNAKKEAEKYKNKAIRMLPEITKDRKMSKILEQLAENLINRKK